MPQPPPKDIGLARSIGICGLFCLLSTWCTLYNKYIFENVFPSSNCLLLVQNIFTVIALLIGRTFKVVEFTPSFTLPDIVCGVAYSVNVMTGLWALVYVNIAMFGALKRGTMMVSWLIEYFVTPSGSTMPTLPPLIVMMAGTLLAGAYDLQFSGIGYLLAAVSCIAQGMAYELGRRMTVNNKGVCSVLLVNSVSAIVLQVVLTLGDGEFHHLAPSKLNAKIIFHFILNSISCLLMNYSIFLNCQVNSPLAHAVTGNVKTYTQTFLGMIFFISKLEWFGWLGVLANFFGGAWFSWVKLQYNLKKQKEKESKEVV
jgi:hypothetical protein